MLICAVNGSPHTNGNTAFLLNNILDNLKSRGADTEFLNIGKIMSNLEKPFCVCCKSPCDASCFKNTELWDAFELLIKADFIIFASPVYFGTMSAQLKAFFDKTRFFRGQRAFEGKFGTAISVGASKYGGQGTTLRAIQDCMFVQGMNIVGNFSQDLPGHQGLCAQAPASEDENAIRYCSAVADRIMEICK